MSKAPERKGLGRGLSALLGDADLGADAGGAANAPVRAGAIEIPIDRIFANPDQPRRHFDEDELEDLARSVSERGVIQPLILRAHPERDGAYQIVAGERRWRAAQRAQLHALPALVRDLSDTDVLEIAIIENVQRTDLNPVEEAMGYRQLMDRFGHTQERLASALGKSRSHIANLLRLLTLPDSVLALLREGRISAGHARALVVADQPERLARQIVEKGLSVRDVERLMRDGAEKPQQKQRHRPEKDADTRALEADLTAHLRLKVAIDHRADGKGGTLQISYRDLDELDGLCQLLTQ